MQEKELIREMAQRAELTQEAATRAYRALQAIVAENASAEIAPLFAQFPSLYRSSQSPV